MSKYYFNKFLNYLSGILLIGSLIGIGSSALVYGGLGKQKRSIEWKLNEGSFLKQEKVNLLEIKEDIENKMDKTLTNYVLPFGISMLALGGFYFYTEYRNDKILFGGK